MKITILKYIRSELSLLLIYDINLLLITIIFHYCHYIDIINNILHIKIIYHLSLCVCMWVRARARARYKVSYKNKLTLQYCHE